MTPVVSCSASSALVTPGNALSPRKNRCVTKVIYSDKSIKHSKLPVQRTLLPFPTTIRAFPRCRIGYSSLSTPKAQRLLSATGTDVAVGEQGSSAAEEEPVPSSEEPSTSGETTEEISSTISDASSSPARNKRPRTFRKSDLPPVKNEELVPGATFTGKVRSIQPFGAFVDFGAFTDGLVHVSKISDNYVKDVASFVSVGQEVKVRLVEVNTESGRISLSMRENDDNVKPAPRKDASDASSSTSGDKGKPPRRNPKGGQRRFESKKVSNFVMGQDLVGTVKNLGRSGAFITLPEGEEGFLPASEELTEGNIPNIMENSSLEVGQEVDVRVLRITRGQATLTMKKDDDLPESDLEVGRGVVHSATNPFVLAFRKNEDISSFLDAREKIVEEVDQSLDSKADEAIKVTDQAVVDGSDMSSLVGNETEAIGDEKLEGKAVVDSELKKEAAIEATGQMVVENETQAEGDGQLELEAAQSSQNTEAETIKAIDQVVESVVDKASLVGEETIARVDGNLELEATASSEKEIAAARTETDEVSFQAASISSSDSKDSTAATQDEAESKVPSLTPTEASLPGQNGNTANSAQSNIRTSSGSAPEATISPALVKQLREETGAGMMDCKKALAESEGDLVQAQEFLRKKGLASAEKKASRTTAEGRIGSYIHDSRIGVLVEVNCETDFVSRGDIFKELVNDLAMQVAACPHVKYVVPDDVPKELVDKEREIEMQKEDLLSKPEQIRGKIVEGRINKRLEELALLEQPYIKDDKVLVKDWVKQTIATIGENIKVKRFVKYNLGEGLEKKSLDFAAEVAAQTAAKSAPAPAKEEQPAAAEPGNPAESTAKVTISAALVKQLREESGAGMMDCKKALSETGGDLEKAQEYLRKKGLSAADKKSGRLAAEGRIGSYIHDSRIGVLIEVNCETDFVGRSDKFKELVDDLAMQVAACPQVMYVSVEDIPETTRNKEKELEMQREDILSKPEHIREKIVEGRISKRLGELALLEHPFIKDDSILIKDLVKQSVAAIGENIKVRRFTRFTLGENLDKESGEAEAAEEAS